MAEQTTHSTEIVRNLVIHDVPAKRGPDISEIIGKFANLVPIGDGLWSADCPCCKNRNPDGIPSKLAIVDNPGGKQRLIFNCPSECSADEICSAIGISKYDLTQEIDKERQGNYHNSGISLLPNPSIAPKAKSDITTFVDVISKHFPMRYNELNQRGEIFDNEHWRDITDADEAIITRYCQDVYDISHRTNLRDAILICQSNKKVNPLTDMLCSLVWDGVPRTASFLHDIMKCDDTKVVSEISQMIFTGGIRRAFEPGCKWDNMPILVGSQGSGKSTIVELLGLGNSALIRTFSGKEAIENINGVWIGEIAELSAMRRAKDLEEIKSFVTTVEDKYRKPYAHNDTRLPRRCIFIGTTNSYSFLTDRTGNRRFFPVAVHSDGKEIWRHVNETKDYILQAWAEAVARYRDGTLPLDYDHSIDADLERIREGYQEEDWKVGMMESYLSTKKNGDEVCVLELWVSVCHLEQDKLTMSDSRKIGEFMDNHQDWKRLPGSGKHYFSGWGQQRGWIKKSFYPF